MNIIPLPYYFVIKIETEKQKERREKIGSLYLHFSEVQMQRNLQCGEIVSMGSIASKHFLDAKIGDTLLVHHFIEGFDKEKSTCIHSDEKFNYYNVTTFDFNGRRNETYGLWNGKEIIPHPDFIFIEPEEKEKEISADEFIEQNTKQVGSLILFDNWHESREEKEAKSKRLMQEIKNQSKGKHLRDDVKIGLETKQREAETITNSLSKQEYVPFKIAACNPSLKLKENVFALNLAGTTELEFMDKPYIVIQSKYCVGTV